MTGFRIATVSAHCDLPCGVYDPAQARIEAESVKGCMTKFHASDDVEFKQRAVIIKEQPDLPGAKSALEKSAAA